MPSRPIQGFPSGLLSLLGLKNLGKLPDTLMDDVRATFELRDWYLRGLRESIFPGVGQVATGGLQDVSYGDAVPEGELWYLHGCGLRVTAANAPASGQWFMSLYVLDGIYASPRESQQYALPVGPPALGYSEGQLFLGGFWMFPGDALRARWFLAAGDSVDRCPVYVSKLKI